MGWHLAPWFPGEKLYLTHGDDPYSAMSKTNFPATMLLIEEAKSKAWFPGIDPTTDDANVGRQPIELNIKYPSAYLMNFYCGDVANGKDHASGDVYNKLYKNFYTVQQLENLGLWNNLNQKLPTFACSM